MAVSTSLIRQSIAMSSDLAKVWFEDRATKKSLEEFKLRGGLRESSKGFVYAYFSADDRAIYIGQTSRGVKARLYDQTSPHMQKTWWSDWAYVRFVSLPKDMDRLVLEFLLILAYSPIENKKPAAINVDELLPI